MSVASSLLSSHLTRPAARPTDSQPPRILARALAFWHLASLDAPTVAVVWAIAIAHGAGIHLKPWLPLLLACGTWTVYVGDRLLDARSAIRKHNHRLLRERHYFHWRHRHTLLPIAVLTAVSSAAMIFGLMPIAARERNSLIASAAIVYFSGVHAPAPFPRWATRIISKEFLVGVLFAAGCSAPTLPFLHAASSSWPMVLSIIFLGWLAWLNCAAIESWESESDSINMPASAILLALTGFGLAIALGSGFAHPSLLLCCSASSAFLIFVLHRLRNRIDSLLLRALADLVLLCPAILLIPAVTLR